MKLHKYIPPITAVFLCIMIVAVFFANIVAQSSDPLPLPQDSTDLTTLFLGDPANYNIVYLVDTDVVTDENFLSPNNALGEISKATALSTWDDVLKYNSEKPIQALVIHESAYSAIDREWVANAWRDGVVVATINVSFAEFAELRDYECARRKVANYESPFTGSFYYVAAQVSLATNPDEQSLLEDSVLRKCDEEHEIGGYTSYSGGQGELYREEDVYYLTARLIANIEKVKEAKYNFDNRFSPTQVPTFVPENSN